MAEPSQSLTFMPDNGVYIVLQLDPVATLEHLDDETAIERAREIKTKKYLGFTAKFIDGPNPEAPFHRFVIRLVSHGLPDNDPENGSNPDMCIPLAPNQAHPTSRTNIPSSQPLPWDDCFQHSDMNVTLGVKNELKDESKVNTLDRGRVIQHKHLVFEDKDRKIELLKASGTYQEPASIMDEAEPEDAEYESEHASASEGSVIQDGDSFDGDSLHEDHDSIASETSELSESISLDEVEEPNDEPLRIRPHVGPTVPLVSVEYDLSVIDDFADPRDLFQDLAAIELLEKELRETSAARVAKLERERLAASPADLQSTPTQPSAVTAPTASAKDIEKCTKGTNKWRQPRLVRMWRSTIRRCRSIL